MEMPVIEPIDLGNGTMLRFVSWKPDRALNPQYDGIPDVDRYGAIITHRFPVIGDEFLTCEGYIIFDGEVQRHFDPKKPRWIVDSWDPLTLSPSIICGCGSHHGFIKEGRWISI